MTRVLRLYVASALATGALLVTATSAIGYIDRWSCGNYYSAQTCYAGTGYRSYIEITNNIGARKAEVCAKGVTAAGNIRSGSGCNHNALGRVSCISSASPHSAAYIYWAGGGGPTTNTGAAKTPGSRQYC
jgi:hypothetical protein